MEYDKNMVGFVVQSYRDGECVRQEFIASDEVSREDPATGESIEVDVTAERYQPLEMVQPVNERDRHEGQERVDDRSRSQNRSLLRRQS